MPSSTAFANEMLKLFLTGVAIPAIADNAASSPIDTLWVAFHTADPGGAGSQATSELSYGEYARQSIPRLPSAWTIVGNIAKPAAAIEFPEMVTGAGGTITHISLGIAQNGASKILARGPFTPNLVISVGTTPRAKAGTEISFDV